MSKVILPKEVADTIEMFRRACESDWEILRIASGDRGVFSQPLHDFIHGCPAVERNTAEIKLMKALAIGYEVEKSPEEEVRECMREWRLQREGIGKIGAVLHVLNTLGIKIAGVNDGR
jgi:hypothetical protein